MVNDRWFLDCSQIQYLWHGLNYRFLSGTMVLEDDNTPLMIGNNITWQMGVNKLCAQVDTLNYLHTVDMNTGRKSTTVSIGFSYCCLVQEDGALSLLGPSAMNDIYDAQVEDKFSANISPKGLSSFTEQMEKFDALRKAVTSAQAAINRGLSALKALI